MSPVIWLRCRQAAGNGIPGVGVATPSLAVSRTWCPYGVSPWKAFF